MNKFIITNRDIDTMTLTSSHSIHPNDSLQIIIGKNSFKYRFRFLRNADHYSPKDKIERPNLFFIIKEDLLMAESVNGLHHEEHKNAYFEFQPLNSLTTAQQFLNTLKIIHAVIPLSKDNCEEIADAYGVPLQEILAACALYANEELHHEIKTLKGMIKDLATPIP